MSTLRGRLLLTLLSVTVLVLGLEIFARFGLRVRPDLERFKLDPELGWTWNPGYDAEEVFYGVPYRMTISEQGIRNGTVVVPKPEGVFRIVALGDSVTEGPGVELEETFVKKIEANLRSVQDHPAVEVVNASTGDYGTQQEAIWLESRGLKLEPDLVLINVYLNDSRTYRNPPAIIASLDSFLGRTSAFYVYYRSLIRDRMATAEIAESDFRFRYSDTWESGSWREDPKKLTQLIQEADGDWGLAWKDSELARIEEGIQEIARTGEQHGFELLIVLFPVDVQVFSETSSALGLEMPQKRLVEFAELEGIPILDILPVLRQYRDRDLYFDQAHLTVEGHRIVAESIAQAIADEALLPGH